MCGIFGWSFKRKSRIAPAQREILAATLAVANSYRGDQSWGCYVVDHNGKASVRKEVGDIAFVHGIGSLGSFNTVFAHTRYATTGRISKENSHPHRAGSILLAHNGVVFNHDELNKRYRRACAVDSQHFAHHLSEGRPFSDIEAYGSIEWTEDAAPRTVYLCRMRSGVLTAYGIKNSRGKQVGVAWSSDAEHLRSAIGAARLDAFPYVKLTEGDVFEVRDGKLYHTTRRLACTAPTWSPESWAMYRTTQTGGRADAEAERNKVIIRRFLQQAGTGSNLTGSESSSSTAPSSPLTNGKKRRIQVDEGLFWDEQTGKLVDTLLDGEPTGAPLDGEPTGEPACTTCGSLAGYDENGDCRECFTPSEEAMVKRIADMTDEEFQAYETCRRLN